MRCRLKFIGRAWNGRAQNSMAGLPAIGYVLAERAARWRSEYEQIARMLQGLLARQQDRFSPDHGSLTTDH